MTEDEFKKVLRHHEFWGQVWDTVIAIAAVVVTAVLLGAIAIAIATAPHTLLTDIAACAFVWLLIDGARRSWNDYQYRRDLAEELRAGWKEEQDRYRYPNLPL